VAEHHVGCGNTGLKWAPLIGPNTAMRTNSRDAVAIVRRVSILPLLSSDVVKLSAMKMNFDERAYRRLFEKIAEQIGAADSKFRETHTGLPLHVVRADAVDAFPEGVELTTQNLDDYAAAVSKDEPFEFRLQG